MMSILTVLRQLAPSDVTIDRYGRLGAHICLPPNGVSASYTLHEVYRQSLLARYLRDVADATRAYAAEAIADRDRWDAKIAASIARLRDGQVSPRGDGWGLHPGQATDKIKADLERRSRQSLASEIAKFPAAEQAELIRVHRRGAQRDRQQIERAASRLRKIANALERAANFCQ